MDMKKLIQKMTDLEAGKQLLAESIVDECGGSMPAAPQQQGNPVTVSVNFNASGAENVMELLNLLKNSGLQAAEGSSEPSQGMRMDMENFRNIVDASKDDDMDDMDDTNPDVKFNMRPTGKGRLSKEVSEWDNEPNEIYADHQTMTKDLSGGLNREKSMYKPAAKGDNPMAVQEGMDPNAIMGQIRTMAKRVETSTDERAHLTFAQEVESELIDLFQHYQQEMDRQKAEAIRNLIRQNKVAQQKVDRRNANNISEVLYSLMRSTSESTFESLKVRLLKALEEKKSKPDYPDLDKDGNKTEPMSKALKDKKKEGPVKEGSTGDYSAKKARAGKDIGKPGKQFSKIAKDAAKRYGSEERGKKVAGAVLSKLRKK